MTTFSICIVLGSGSCLAVSLLLSGPFVYLFLMLSFQISWELTLTHHVTVAGGRPPKKQWYKPQVSAASYRYFLRGQSDKAAAADFTVAKQKRIQLKAYDRLLKSFQYREALDAAVATGRPEIISSLVEELATRSGLPAALGGLPAAVNVLSCCI